MVSSAENPEGGKAQSSAIESVLVDRFEVLEKLGEGYVGEVYKALDRTTGEFVAVKVLRLESVPGRTGQRFLNEIRVFNKLVHPNIATYHGFGRTQEGRPYIAMELVDGPSLDELAEGYRFPVVAALRIARQIARALGAAHELGVIHRDLKPPNVLMACDDRGGHVVKLVDFGLAKLPRGIRPKRLPALTGDHVRVGTPGYMAPEQSLALPVDATADLYSLGVIVYELLTGHEPFVAKTKSEIYRRHRHAIPPPFADICPDVAIDPEVEELVMALLAKDPGERPQSAESVVSRLDQLIERLSVREQPATLVEAPSRPKFAEPIVDLPLPDMSARPHRRQWVIGAAVAAILLAILVWVLDTV